MGIFDRFFSRKPKVDFGYDEINDIWQNITDDLPRGALSQFIEDAEDVFTTAFVDHDLPSEEVIAARQQFEDLLSEFHIDIRDFDWDAWRDWYEGQS